MKSRNIRPRAPRPVKLSFTIEADKNRKMLNEVLREIEERGIKNGLHIAGNKLIKSKSITNFENGCCSHSLYTKVIEFGSRKARP